MNEQSMGTIVSGSMACGLGATIAGGNFWDGFRNGAISTGLNHARHMVQQAITTPKVYVDFKDITPGSSKAEFLQQLNTRLVDNGVKSKVVISEINTWQSFVDFLFGNPQATVHITDFNAGDVSERYVAGFASKFSNKATVCNGLKAFGNKEEFPVWMYVHVAMHELGQAVWGFSDVGFKGDVNNIMDYSSWGNQGAFFIKVHYEMIKNSSWGGN
jgi:hypothetical protein